MLVLMISLITTYANTFKLSNPYLSMYEYRSGYVFVACWFVFQDSFFHFF